MSARTNLDNYKPSPHWIRYVSNYLALFLGAVLTKSTIAGRRHIPEKGPYIVAANHFSMADPAFVLYALQKPAIFMAASDQIIPWYYKWAAGLYGFIPTNRSRLAPSTIKQARYVLRNKQILGIFPEGTSTSPYLREAKRGVIYLATIEKVSILPIGIYGLDRFWEQLFRGVRPKITIKIGSPFQIKEDNSTDSAENINWIGETIMCRIAALLPDTTHGLFTNNEQIKKYRKENEV